MKSCTCVASKVLLNHGLDCAGVKNVVIARPRLCFGFFASLPGVGLDALAFTCFLSLPDSEVS
eukprot:m.206217 g.206217  ORF g.206217 m.206217 type:complete len:63 (-) comp16904_c0_seq1:476-664(-)